MISRMLLPDDLVWALDHSRRRFRVRPSLVADRASAWNPAGCITVVRIGDGHSVAMLERCAISPDPWVDTDAYADFRVGAIERKRTLREQQGRA